VTATTVLQPAKSASLSSSEADRILKEAQLARDEAESIKKSASKEATQIIER
jgi:hypothetical protein